MPKATKKATTKASAKPTKQLLTHAQRSEIARLAALKAHTHKSFQSERNATERREQIAKYNTARIAFAKTPLARKLAA